MGVRVYFETENLSWACEVAYFNNEDIYDACIDALEEKAKSLGYIVTESVEDDEDDEEEKKFIWVYQYRESGGEDMIELFSQLPTRDQLNKIILDNLGIDAEGLRAKGETLGLNDMHNFHQGRDIGEEYVKGERESYVPAPEGFCDPEFYENLYQQDVIGGEE